MTNATKNKNSLLAALLSWILPGLGHLYLGKWKKAILYFVILNACLIYGGTSLGYAGEMSDGKSASFQNVSPSYPFHFAAQMGLGAPAMVIGYQNRIVDKKWVQGIANFDVSTLYIDIAGLLNYLIAMHVLLMSDVLREKASDKTAEQMVAEVVTPMPEPEGNPALAPPSKLSVPNRPPGESEVQSPDSEDSA